MLKKVISGGQTGVDQAALRQARFAGIATGGTAPRGWMTEEGPAPWLADYGLVENKHRGYPARTYENAVNSDGTVLFGDMNSDGSILTMRCCGTKKPFICNPTMEELIYFIWNSKIEVLNVAGNRRSKLTPEKLREIIQILRDVFMFFAKFYQLSDKKQRGSN